MREPHSQVAELLIIFASRHAFYCRRRRIIIRRRLMQRVLIALPVMAAYTAATASRTAPPPRRNTAHRVMKVLLVTGRLPGSSGRSRHDVASRLALQGCVAVLLPKTRPHRLIPRQPDFSIISFALRSIFFSICHD